MVSFGCRGLQPYTLVVAGLVGAAGRGLALPVRKPLVRAARGDGHGHACTCCSVRDPAVAVAPRISAASTATAVNQNQHLPDFDPPSPVGVVADGVDAEAMTAARLVTHSSGNVLPLRQISIILRVLSCSSARPRTTTTHPSL